MNIEQARFNMIEQQIRTWDVIDPGVLGLLGEVFPLTHFLRIARAILLKGSGALEIMPSVWPLALILLVVSVAAMKRYNRTLD